MIQGELCYDDLNISLSEIFESLQSPDVDASFCQEVLGVIDEVRPLLLARYRVVVSDSMEGFSPGRVIMGQLRGAEYYAFFIATGGVEFQHYLDVLHSDGDIVRMFIADGLGSVIAEHCADAMEESLRNHFHSEGMLLTNRFSPGYCGWDVCEQRLLFRLFDGDSCGVRLSASSLMMPIKSVSGVIGVGRSVCRHDYPCGLCELTSCYKRRKKS